MAPLTKDQLARLTRDEAFALEARILLRLIPALEFKEPSVFEQAKSLFSAVTERRTVSASPVYDRLATSRALIDLLADAAVGADFESDPTMVAKWFRELHPTERSAGLHDAMCTAIDALVQAGTRRGRRGFADLQEVVEMADEVYRLRANGSAAVHDAAVLDDYTWIIENHTARNVPEQVFDRILWPAGVPNDWRFVISAWFALLRNDRLQDDIARYEALLDEKATGDFFISHSSRDRTFAKKLRDALSGAGARCFLAEEDLRTGEEFGRVIREMIETYGYVLLILSKHAIASTWVRTEVTAALEKEKQFGAGVLLPISIDKALPADHDMVVKIRSEKQIGDFTGWRDPVRFESALAKLARDTGFPNSRKPPL